MNNLNKDLFKKKYLKYKEKYLKLKLKSYNDLPDYVFKSQIETLIPYRSDLRKRISSSSGVQQVNNRIPLPPPTSDPYSRPLTPVVLTLKAISI